jgi:ferredoxin-thioredoxin reductase catalytic subunit
MPRKMTVAEYREVLRKFAASKELALNPDADLVDGLVDGLLHNREKHGYPSCPCCFATGDRTRDADIICPCDDSRVALPRDGICRCGLYVTPAYLEGLDRPEPDGTCAKDDEQA